MGLYFKITVVFFGLAAALKVLGRVATKQPLEGMDAVDIFLYAGMFVWGMTVWMKL
jgi:hypothetical protein